MKKLLPLFSRPSHYLGSEINSVHKDLDSIAAHVGLAFPDLYEVGMSYLGQKILYDAVNQYPTFYAERVFAPTEDVAEVLWDNNEPLATLESDTPLSKLDVLSFSLTHELCYTNVLYMLDLAHIPLHAQERKETDPLVLAGGGCVFNAEPMAPFFDVMVLGDGEEVLPELLEVLIQSKQEGLSRQKRIHRLSQIAGVYIPGYFEPDSLGKYRSLKEEIPLPEKRLVRDMETVRFPVRQVVPFGRPVHDRFSVEIARGCTRGCRFCQAGMIYRPVRERSVSTLQQIIDAGLEHTGNEELSFLSLSTGDFSALESLFRSSYTRCQEEQVSISLPSLRVGSVSAELMKLLISIRRTGLTLAPEAGTQRLRDVINKGITEEALLEHTRTAFSLGWQQVKLYFMIGLPTETEADLDGILDLCQKVAATAGSQSKRLQITAAVSPFVPKPHTPFQWERQLSTAEVEEKLMYLQTVFRKHRRFRLKWHHSEMTFLEGVFSRGDRALAPVIETAYRNGALFTSWSDHPQARLWQEAFSSHAIIPDYYLAERESAEPLPWEHLRSGVSRNFLLKERRRAREMRITPDCRYASCRSCGVCTLDGRRSELQQQSFVASIEPVMNQKNRDQEQSVFRAPRQQRVDLHLRVQRFRLWYTKTAEAVYLSQLELQRVFERAFRRIQMPLSFSAGFHPAPLLSFSRALPVGLASQCEWMDFFVRIPIDPEESAHFLHTELPKGMQLVTLEELPCQKKMPQSVRERFTLNFENLEFAERFAAQMRVFMQCSDFFVSKKTKRGTLSKIDIRPLVTYFTSAELMQEIEFTWEEQYVSPLFLGKAIDPEFSLLEMSVEKSAQFFER